MNLQKRKVFMERPMSKEVQDWMEMEKRIHEKEMAMLDKLLEEKRRAEAEAEENLSNQFIK